MGLFDSIKDKVEDAADTAGDAASDAVDTVEDAVDDATGGGGSSQRSRPRDRSTFDRAQDAGEAAPPVDATPDSSVDERGLEEQASANGGPTFAGDSDPDPAGDGGSSDPDPANGEGVPGPNPDSSDDNSSDDGGSNYGDTLTSGSSGQSFEKAQDSSSNYGDTLTSGSSGQSFEKAQDSDPAGDGAVPGPNPEPDDGETTISDDVNEEVAEDAAKDIREEIKNEGINGVGGSARTERGPPGPAASYASAEAEWERNPENFDITVGEDEVSVSLSEQGRRRAERSEAEQWASAHGLEDASVTRLTSGGYEVQWMEDGELRTQPIAFTDEAASELGEQTSENYGDTLTSGSSGQSFEEAQESSDPTAGTDIAQTESLEEQMQTEYGLDRGEDYRIDRQQTEDGSTRYQVELTDRGRRELTQPQEQVGDLDWSPTRDGDPLERRIDQAATDFRRGARDIAEGSADPTVENVLSNPVATAAAGFGGLAWAADEAGADDLAGVYRGQQAATEEFGEGVVEGGVSLANLPAYASTGMEAVEAGAYLAGPVFRASGQARDGDFAASQESLDTAGERAGDAGEAAKMLGARAVSSARENPSSTAGMLAGSAVVGAGAVGGASRVSSTAGRATGFAVDPIESITRGVASRASSGLARKIGRLRSKADNSEPGVQTYSADIDSTLSRQGLPSQREKFGEGRTATTLEKDRVVRVKNSDGPAIEEGTSLYDPESGSRETATPRERPPMEPGSETVEYTQGAGAGGTDGTGSLLDADAVDNARGVSGPSRVDVARGRFRREVASPLSDKIGAARDRLVDEVTGSSRGQAELVPKGRQTESETSTGTPEFRDAGETEFEPSRGEILEGSPRDRLSDDVSSRSLEQRRQNAGDYEATRDPLDGARRRGRRAERREVRVDDDLGTRTETLTLGRRGSGLGVGGGLLSNVGVGPGSDVGVGPGSDVDVGTDVEVGPMTTIDTTTDTATEVRTTSDTTTDSTPTDAPIVPNDPFRRRRGGGPVDLDRGPPTRSSPSKSRESEPSTSVSGLSLGGGPVSSSDGPLASGWVSETVTDVALGGLRAERSLSQSELEDTGANAFGEMPTFAMVRGSESERTAISETLDLLGGDVRL